MEPALVPLAIVIAVGLEPIAAVPLPHVQRTATETVFVSAGPVNAIQTLREPTAASLLVLRMPWDRNATLTESVTLVPEIVHVNKIGLERTAITIASKMPAEFAMETRDHVWDVTTFPTLERLLTPAESVEEIIQHVLDAMEFHIQAFWQTTVVSVVAMDQPVFRMSFAKPEQHVTVVTKYHR